MGKMMLEIWKQTMQLYSDYIGSGMMMGLFLGAVCYLWLGEKESPLKMTMAAVPSVLLGLFFCPPFAALVYTYLDEEIYYRHLWLLPMTGVIAYALGKLVLQLQGVRRLIAAAAACAILMVCGDYVYDNSYFTKAENPWHVPSEVVEICDEIIVEGREVKAVFPSQLVQYVRQYTPYILMPYGREMIVERWQTYNEMYEAYELGVPEADVLAETARKFGCQYIIWDTAREITGDLENSRYELIKQVGQYDVYRDREAYLGL